MIALFRNIQLHLLSFKIISEEIIDVESCILQMIGYDINIIVPQLYFSEAKSKLVAKQGDIQQLIEFSKIFIRFLLKYSCLQYESIIIFLEQQIWLRNYKQQQQQICQRMMIFLLDNNQEANIQTQKKIQEMTYYFDQCRQILKS
ncbi:unnamed protein product [Paramecium pentaurelia]|uniref:Uncharacterized protein n=1 Tax=Paramecium pentaurelia TaxID=43138 RepID=A0A8S1X872_9CILI|nr:unnamed protein product [Paramecium pentaurelia]